MQLEEVKFKAKVWMWEGKAAWHFVSLPKTLSQNLKKSFGGLTAGFGSLPVTVKVGETSWKTSIFPDSKSGCFLLPIKASVRKAEKITTGKTISFVLRVMV